MFLRGSCFLRLPERKEVTNEEDVEKADAET